MVERGETAGVEEWSGSGTPKSATRAKRGEPPVNFFFMIEVKKWKM